MTEEKTKIKEVLNYFEQESKKLLQDALRKQAQAEIYDDCAERIRWTLEQDGIDNKK